MIGKALLASNQEGYLRPLILGSLFGSIYNTAGQCLLVVSFNAEFRRKSIGKNSLL